MANDDQISGAVRNLKGRAQTAIGSATGDDETQARGAVNQVAGRAQSLFGRARNAAGNAAQDLSDDIDDTADELNDNDHNRFSDAMDRAAETGRYYKRRAANYVEDHTGVTLVAVAAASFLFGLLLGVRRD